MTLELHLIRYLPRQIVPIAVFGALALYGYLGDGLKDGTITMPSISGMYTQTANEVALRQALFPSQGNAFVMRATL